MEEVAKDYELLCILSPKIEGEDLDKEKNHISEIINKLEGAISFKESSKKPLAYPINKERQGIFLISQVSIVPEKLIELSKELKASKQVLRYLVSQMTPQREQEKTTTRKPSAKPRKMITKKEEPEPEKPSGETLAEIDKKLDQIIGDI